jgi:curved DNA-binding protein CbpA
MNTNRQRSAAKARSGPESRSPYQVLGLSAGASEEQIRRAYLEKVRQSPPERDPEGFKEIRRAYGVLQDGAKRRELELSLYRRESGLDVGTPEVDFPSLYIRRIFRMLLASSDFELEDFGRDFLALDQVVDRL